jgi:hypothetical protein
MVENQSEKGEWIGFWWIGRRLAECHGVNPVLFSPEIDIVE